MASSLRAAARRPTPVARYESGAAAVARPVGPRSGVPAGPLVHEVAFAALYAAIGARLMLRPQGPAWGELRWWVVLAACSAALVWLGRRAPGATTWRVRLGAYVVLMNVAYSRLDDVVAALGGVRRDAELLRLDTLLFGRPLPLALDGWVAPLASDVLSACYLFLFPYLVASCVRHLARWRRDHATAIRFYEGVFTVYALGLVGYLLVPARGPWLDVPTLFPHPIVGGWLTALDARIVAAGSNGVDVFPSLHVAVSAFVLVFDARTAPRRALWCAIPVVGLWVSTLYLRYHYGVDVLAGFATAGIGLAVALRRSPAGTATSSDWRPSCRVS